MGKTVKNNRNIIPRIPILMYHSVDDDKRKNIAIRINSFARQMQYLFDKGYQTITLDQFYGFVSNGFKIPKKTIILTFDDGYNDNYSVVFPILRKYNFVANFFITTNYVGTSKAFDWDEKISKGRMVLSWEEIKEMSDHSMLIGSHTCSHPLLAQIPLEDARYEIEKSKFTIEDKTNKPVNFLTYPKSSFNADIKEIAKRAGYLGACTIRLSVNQKQDMFSLERTGIYRTDNMLSFEIKLISLSSYLQKIRLINTLGRALFAEK